jgi:hypothetical protein
LAPQHDKDAMRIRPFTLSYRENPSSFRVEQIRYH